MFFVLYALGLIVLSGGIALGMSLIGVIATYAILAVLLSAWIGMVKARRRARVPPRERRRTSLPLQPTHW